MNESFLTPKIIRRYSEMPSEEMSSLPEGEFESDSNAPPSSIGAPSGSCSECGLTGVPLLLCDDLATENSAPLPYNPMVHSKNRYALELVSSAWIDLPLNSSF